MQTVFMVFMIFVSLMCTFSVLVVLRDIIKEIIAAKSQKKDEAPEAKAPVVAAPVAQPVAPAAAEEPVAPEAPEAPEAPAAKAEAEAAEEDEEDADTISFSKGATQTLEEKYLALTAEQRGWYDAIIKHAANVEGAKRIKNTRYEEYKVGQGRLVRMLIKRGILFCELYLPNSNFKTYVNENKLSVKTTATVVRVMDEASMSVVLNGIDIAVQTIAEEKEYKKQLAREKRRAKRQADADTKED